MTIGDSGSSLQGKSREKREGKGRGEKQCYFFVFILFLNSTLAAFEAFADR